MSAPDPSSEIREVRAILLRALHSSEIDSPLSLRSLAETLVQELEATEAALRDWTSACSCGHPLADHETYDDGIGCAEERCKVGCVFCAPGVADELGRLRAQLAQLEEKLRGLGRLG